MVIHKQFLLVLLGVLAFTQVCGQQAFYQKNLRTKYLLTSDFHVKHRIYHPGDSIYLFFEVTTNLEEDITQTFDFKYNISEDYKDLAATEDVVIDMSKSLLGKIENVYHLKVALPDLDKKFLFVLQIQKKGSLQRFEHDIFINEKQDQNNAGVFLYDPSTRMPVISPFYDKNKEIAITTVDNSAKVIYAYYYATDFDLSVAPMITEKKNVAKTISIDSTFTIAVNTPIKLSNKGLYFFQTDSASIDGISIRAVDAPYPKYYDISNLLQPLVFLSTNGEVEEMENANDYRAAFEQQWLNMSPDKETAAKSIKNYYERVYAANYFFTNYKEGWRTDMGMIYIIYGDPDKVVRGEDYEDWVYNNDATVPVVRFTFVKLRNIFCPDNYYLVRDKNFDKHWFKSIESWREGRKNL